MASRVPGALVAALLALLSPSFSHAQAAPDAVVRLTPQQAYSFGSAFTALAQQAHAAVVAEDQPLHPTLTPQALAGLKLNRDGEPLSTLLPKLAAAYDYDVQPSGKAFLLKKRYTDVADLPSVTVKECALALEEVNRYAESFNPHIPLGQVDKSPAISDLIYSLTPEQLQAMGDSKRGVPVASLSPVQQQEVQQLVMHFCVQLAISDLPAALSALNQVAAGDPQFGWRSFPQMKARLFGFDAPFGYEGFLPLSRPDQVTVHIGIGMEIHPQPWEGEPPTTKATAMQLTSAPDPTDPLPVPVNAPKSAPPVSSSLADIIARLNARAGDSLKGDGLKVSVEPYLAPKQATVFGEEAVTPRQELDALADVYGLRVFKDDPVGGHDRLRLTRRTAQVPLTLIALHDSILQALPDPLVRAYRKHDRFAFDPAVNSPSGVPARLVPAVRQIRAAVEPRLRASKDGRVALSSLSEREGRSLATLLMLEAMDALDHWVRADLPDTITRYDELRLGGGLYEEDGKKKLTLALLLPDLLNPNNLTPGPAVGNLNYDPVNHTL